MSQQAPAVPTTTDATAAAKAATAEVLPAEPTASKPIEVQTRPANRTPADIEAEMDATRQRLATTVEQLKEAVTPSNIAKREVERVKAFYVSEDGAVRYDHVAITAGVVVGTVVGTMLLVKGVKAIF